MYVMSQIKYTQQSMSEVRIYDTNEDLVKY